MSSSAGNVIGKHLAPQRVEDVVVHAVLDDRGHRHDHTEHHHQRRVARHLARAHDRGDDEEEQHVGDQQRELLDYERDLVHARQRLTVEGDPQAADGEEGEHSEVHARELAARGRAAPLTIARLSNHRVAIAISSGTVKRAVEGRLTGRSIASNGTRNSITTKPAKAHGRTRVVCGQSSLSSGSSSSRSRPSLRALARAARRRRLRRA